MPITARVQPIERDLQFIAEEFISPERRAEELAKFARTEITAAKATNKRLLGREPPSKTFVDGREGAPLESVRPGGVIVCDFQLIGEVLFYIDEQLRTHSPVGTVSRPGHPGLYKRSHALFADGQQILLGGIDINVFPLAAEEYIFLNLVPYARKIERGSSTQAPEGVYQVVAHLAQQKFRNLGRITFSYRTAIGGGIVGGKLGNRSEQRQPAIIIRQRT